MSVPAPPPLVSVLMNVYNGERFVGAACRSVLGQTLGDLELIVVDDGSTDRTPAILAALAAEDPRVLIVTQPNAGITAALNAGLRRCRGEFVAKMDADDVSLPDRFAKQVAFLRDHPDVLVVGGAWEIIDERDRPITTLRPPTDDAAIQATLLRGHAALTHSCAMIRRRALEQVGGYDESFKSNAEDLDLWLRLGEVGKLHNLADVVLRYRIHAASVSETRRAEQREHARRAVERAWARRGITDGTFDATEH
ncbi:MAG TPA: glycosyltransferase, partial [Tepidisphaeraceae bacterium]|nr:glycosyltransferase [Tepidisphaeraceae bacterium]